MFVNIGMWLGAVRHRDHQPASGFPPRCLGDVLAYGLGLGDVLRDYGPVLHVLFLFVRLLPALSISEMQELVHVSKRSTRATEPGRPGAPTGGHDVGHPHARRTAR